jgi:hypothetical protein
MLITLFVRSRRGYANTKKGTNRSEKEQAKPLSGDSASVQAKVNGKAEEERPTCGDWNVVIATPGIKWFEEEFCRSLSV